jgi:two-component system, NarL family, response regulator LiaR
LPVPGDVHRHAQVLPQIRRRRRACHFRAFSIVHAVVRQGLRMFLGLDPELDVIGEAGDGVEATAGQVQLSPQAAARLLREVRAPESPEVLTERESDVLRLLARGKANKEIARELDVGEQTVKSHVGHILAKLSVRSRIQAALQAVRIGLVPADAAERSG